MQVETFLKLVDGVYHAQIGLAEKEPLTPAETEAFNHFGDVVIDTGGIINYGEEQTFTLPTNSLWFPCYFPAKQTFAIADNADAGSRAQGWLTTIQTRLVAARDAQVAKSSTTQHSIVTV